MNWVPICQKIPDCFGSFRNSSVCLGCFNIGSKNRNKPKKKLVGFTKQTETNAKQILFRFVSVRTEIFFFHFEDTLIRWYGGRNRLQPSWGHRQGSGNSGSIYGPWGGENEQIVLRLNSWSAFLVRLLIKNTNLLRLELLSGSLPSIFLSTKCYLRIDSSFLFRRYFCMYF